MLTTLLAGNLTEKADWENQQALVVRKADSGSAFRFRELAVKLETQKTQDPARDRSSRDDRCRGEGGHATLGGEFQNSSGRAAGAANTGAHRSRRGRLDPLAPVFAHNSHILPHVICRTAFGCW